MTRLTLAFVALALSGCAFMRSAAVPMPSVAHLAPPERHARGLVVLMPGYGDGPDDFVERGFVERLAALDPAWDVIAADAHVGYYRGGFTVVERLHQDVIAPALTRGYEQVWLVGVSMGGYGALAYAMAHPELVTGVIALAPYLGPSEVIDQVRAAGGLRAWSAPDAAALSAIEDGERRHATRLWTFLQAAAADPAAHPALYFGVGRDDSLRPAVALVTAALPDERSALHDGGHGWVVWRPLFEALLPRTLGP